MTYKEINEQAFESWEAVGIVIPPISKIMKKINLGLKAGLGNVGYLIFGMYSVKLCSIPM